MIQKIFLLLFLFSNNTYAAGTINENGLIIDPDYQVIAEEIKRSGEKKCSSLKLFKRLSCMQNVRAEYVKKGKVRGTKEYLKEHYSGLETSRLISNLEELFLLTNSARDSTLIDPEFGEITQDILSTEISHIRKILSQRQSKIKQSECDAIFNSKNKNCEML